MSPRFAGIICHPAADPRTAPPGTPAHLIHEEIPLVEAALRARGWEPLLVPIGADVLAALGRLAAARPGLVINLCDELPGGSEHEAHLMGALELLGLRVSGAPSFALALCRDKVKTKLILRACAVPTPPFVLVEGETFSVEGLRFPLIAKPAAEDGSLGITDESVAGDEPALRRIVGRIGERYGAVLIEEFIEGRELNVPLFGNTPPRVLPVSEIDFAGLPAGHPRICGYEAKWTEDDVRYRGTVGICPAPLSALERDRIERWSLLAFHVLGLRDYARVDWRLSPERGLQFLEANPNPDISPTSGFMRSLRAAGMDYPDLVEALIEGGAARPARRPEAGEMRASHDAAN